MFKYVFPSVGNPTQNTGFRASLVQIVFWVGTPTPVTQTKLSG